LSGLWLYISSRLIVSGSGQKSFPCPRAKCIPCARNSTSICITQNLLTLRCHQTPGWVYIVLERGQDVTLLCARNKARFVTKYLIKFLESVNFKNDLYWTESLHMSSSNGVHSTFDGKYVTPSHMCTEIEAIRFVMKHTYAGTK
jgi:hypothetical protein